MEDQLSFLPTLLAPTAAAGLRYPLPPPPLRRRCAKGCSTNAPSLTWVKSFEAFNLRGGMTSLHRTLLMDAKLLSLPLELLRSWEYECRTVAPPENHCA